MTKEELDLEKARLSTPPKAASAGVIGTGSAGRRLRIRDEWAD